MGSAPRRRPHQVRAPARWALTHSRLVTDDPARPFYLEVNRRPQFVLGVNAVVPSDPALEDRLRLRLIEMWRAGGNTVRFWAGGTYPSERLLRTCDSLGLMVWQDFAFTGTAYPGDSTFRAWVRAEAEYQVKRMAEHPSVVLFCGNNEIDVAWRAWGWQKTYRMSPADSTQLWANNHWIFDELLPSVVAAHAPRPGVPGLFAREQLGPPRGLHARRQPRLARLARRAAHIGPRRARGSVGE